MQLPTKTAKNFIAFSSFSILQISVGVVYLWFGGLKFFQGVSPAEHLATQTIHKLTFGLINDQINILMLATWECIVGILLILGKWLKPALALLFLHMACTFTPFLFFPHETFRFAPYGLSLIGQYIMKNVIIIAVGVVLWKKESGRVIERPRGSATFDKGNLSETINIPQPIEELRQATLLTNSN